MLLLLVQAVLQLKLMALERAAVLHRLGTLSAQKVEVVAQTQVVAETVAQVEAEPGQKVPRIGITAAQAATAAAAADIHNKNAELMAAKAVRSR